MLARLLADDALERMLDRPELERILEQLLESPGAERLVTQIVESRLVEQAVTELVDDTAARLPQSQAVWTLIHEVAQSPAVTDAISQQGKGMADQFAGEVRQRADRVGDRLERAARRLLHRPRTPTRRSPRRRYERRRNHALPGLVTRLIAFAADAAVINGVAVVVGVVVGLGLSLFDLPEDVRTALVAIGAAITSSGPCSTSSRSGRPPGRPRATA